MTRGHLTCCRWVHSFNCLEYKPPDLASCTTSAVQSHPREHKARDVCLSVCQSVSLGFVCGRMASVCLSVCHQSVCLSSVCLSVSWVCLWAYGLSLSVCRRSVLCLSWVCMWAYGLCLSACRLSVSLGFVCGRMASLFPSVVCLSVCLSWVCMSACGLCLSVCISWVCMWAYGQSTINHLKSEVSLSPSLSLWIEKLSVSDVPVAAVFV